MNAFLAAFFRTPGLASFFLLRDDGGSVRTAGGIGQAGSGQLMPPCLQAILTDGLHDRRQIWERLARLTIGPDGDDLGAFAFTITLLTLHCVLLSWTAS